MNNTNDDLRWHVQALSPGETLLRVDLADATHFAVERSDGIRCGCGKTAHSHDRLSRLHQQTSHVLPPVSVVATYDDTTRSVPAGDERAQAFRRLIDEADESIVRMLAGELSIHGASSAPIDELRERLVSGVLHRVEATERLSAKVQERKRSANDDERTS